ncbi:MAG: hypothetical protein ACOX6T_17685 [Myxococcales bacterium]|jgi:hypothetical protein
MAGHSRRQKTVVFAVLALGLAAALVLYLRSEDEEMLSLQVADSVAPSQEAPSVDRSSRRTSKPRPSQPAAQAAEDAGEAAGAPAVVIRAGWGSGSNELGRTRPSEGNPEAPMSFATDGLGRSYVLDQVNGRIVRYDKDGNPIDSFLTTQQAPQDLVISPEGNALVLDRLVDKSVAVLGPDGRLLGELPVEGRGIEEGGGVTGVFVDGTDVYVEREHGDLVRIGDTEGKVDEERPEVPGRPSRDGQSFLNAGIIDAASGRVYVNSVERPSLQHRFTRELRMGAPSPGILLLDTDLRGNIYLGVLLELGGAGPEDEPMPSIRVVCMSPTDGQPWGSADLPVSPMPEETFRDIVVLDEGGVLFAFRSESGVAYQRYVCR